MNRRELITLTAATAATAMAASRFDPVRTDDRTVSWNQTGSGACAERRDQAEGRGVARRQNSPKFEFAPVSAPVDSSFALFPIRSERILAVTYVPTTPDGLCKLINVYQCKPPSPFPSRGNWRSSASGATLSPMYALA